MSAPASDPSSSDSNVADTPRSSSPNGEWFSARWEAALAECKRDLDKLDYQRLLEFNTCDSLLQNLKQLQSNYRGQAWMLQGSRIATSLDQYRNFSLALAVASQRNTINTALLWGAVNLTVEICAAHGTLFTNIVEMIADMGHDLEMFSSYDWVAAGEPQMERVLVDVVVEVILFWVHTTKFLRRNPIGECIERLNIQRQTQPIVTLRNSQSRQNCMAFCLYQV